jgi:hypothetical protein
MPPRKRTLTRRTIRTIEILWKQGLTIREVCDGAGITQDQFRTRRRDQLAHLPARGRGKGGGGGRHIEDISVEEIWRRAAIIREGWTEAERLDRKVGGYRVGSAVDQTSGLRVIRVQDIARPR